MRPTKAPNCTQVTLHAEPKRLAATQGPTQLARDISTEVTQSLLTECDLSLSWADSIGQHIRIRMPSVKITSSAVDLTVRATTGAGAKAILALLNLCCITRLLDVPTFSIHRVAIVLLWLQASRGWYQSNHPWEPEPEQLSVYWLLESWIGCSVKFALYLFPYYLLLLPAAFPSEEIAASEASPPQNAASEALPDGRPSATVIDGDHPVEGGIAGWVTGACSHAFQWHPSFPSPSPSPSPSHEMSPGQPAPPRLLWLPTDHERDHELTLLEEFSWLYPSTLWSSFWQHHPEGSFLFDHWIASGMAAMVVAISLTSMLYTLSQSKHGLARQLQRLGAMLWRVRHHARVIVCGYFALRLGSASLTETLRSEVRVRVRVLNIHSPLLQWPLQCSAVQCSAVQCRGAALAACDAAIRIQYECINA